jgi:iron complex transport system ATP-binding protein
MLIAQSISVIRQRRKLLDDVSLTARPGELLALMGENGAGKSTLLRVLSGDLVPDHGMVGLAGRELRKWKPAERARLRAVLPQESILSFQFSAIEVSVLGRTPWCSGHPGKMDYDIARDALARVDALHLENRLYPTLSGGERARVQLARVLCQIWGAWNGLPRCLLLDEPIAALDIAHQHLALKIVRDFAHDANIAVVVVLHDLNLAARYADEVALLKQGRIFAKGPPEVVLTPEAALACFSTRMVRVAHPVMGHSVLMAC